MNLKFAGIDWTPARFIAAALIIPLLLWLAWGLGGVWLISRYWGGEGRLSDLGPTGDIFGGINALFAAYAFIGVAAAAIFQYQTFTVVKKQQTQQSFEPLFFQLVSLTRSAFPSKLAGPNTTLPVSSSEQIGNLAHELVSSSWFSQLGEMSKRQISEQVEIVYQRYYLANDSTLGPYFRLLYQVFKLIDGSDLPKEARLAYANIARATLTGEEIFLLTVNCTTPRGMSFVPLIESYGLLKHQATRANHTPDLVAEALREKTYAPTAWGSADERERFWSEQPAARPPNMA